MLPHSDLAFHLPDPAGGANGASAGMRGRVPGLDGGAQNIQASSEVHGELMPLPSQQQGHVHGLRIRHRILGYCFAHRGDVIWSFPAMSCKESVASWRRRPGRKR